MARRWAGRAFFPITFLVILFMPIFIWSPQTKDHVLRLSFQITLVPTLLSAA